MPISDLDALRRLLKRCEVEPCTCPLVEFPEGAGPSRHVGLPHFQCCDHTLQTEEAYRGGQGFPLSFTEWLHLLWTLTPSCAGPQYPDRYREPPAPAEPMIAQSPAARVQVMRERWTKGEHIRGPADLPLGRIEDVGVTIHHHPNGEDRIGELQTGREVYPRIKRSSDRGEAPHRASCDQIRGARNDPSLSEEAA
jgi:hypothetical protein